MSDTLPQIGTLAPDFTLPGDGGTPVALSDYRGKPLVLFFYPKDDTPTCTTEARGFSDAISDFAAAGAAVLGISKDSAKKHDKFRAKYGLAYRLASDEESDLCERYGVWAEKSMYGKTYMGIVRTTFLIHGDGKIAAIWPQVKVAGHVEAVLEAVRAL